MTTCRIAQGLRARREEAGLTPQDLGKRASPQNAELAAVIASTVEALEAGVLSERDVSAGTWLVLMDALKDAPRPTPPPPPPPEDPRAIVLALAECEAPLATVWDRHYRCQRRCMLCRPEHAEHTDDCPLMRARRYARGER